MASWGMPVACTVRGCITNKTVSRQVQLDATFMQILKQRAMSRKESFTTVLRRHLVQHANPPTPATLADARRYREEILHLKDEPAVKEVSGLTLEEYDEFVILPFLQQAALQQQYKTETPEELYAALSRNRFILILQPRLKWDKSTSTVIKR